MFSQLHQTLTISISSPVIAEQINEKLADKVGNEVFSGENLQQIMGANAFLQTTLPEKNITCTIEPNQIQCAITFEGKVSLDTFNQLTSPISKILDVFMITGTNAPISITLTVLPDYPNAMETLKALFTPSIFQNSNIIGGGVRLFIPASTSNVIANEIFIEPFLSDDNKAYIQGSFKYAQISLDHIHSVCSKDIDTYYSMLSYIANLLAKSGEQ